MWNLCPQVLLFQTSNGDEQTHGVPWTSTKTSHNFFIVNNPAVTFCLQMPLCLMIGLAGSPLSLLSHIPIQTPSPQPLCGHGPWASAAPTPWWPKLPALSLPFIHVWPLSPWMSSPQVLVSWLTVYRDFPLPDVSWKPPVSMGHPLPAHSCPLLWAYTHWTLHSASSRLFLIRTQSLFTYPCSIPVASAPRLPDLIQSLYVPAEAGNFANLDICLAGSLPSILSLCWGIPLLSYSSVELSAHSKIVFLKTLGKNRQKILVFPHFICSLLLPNANLVFY